MTYYARELESWQPGQKKPPIQVGPYDNPLTWNMLDPYGADRPHQRRPSSTSRTLMENHMLPVVFRDYCAHRWIPLQKCYQNQRPLSYGMSTNCLEFIESYHECKAFEKYYSMLVKDRFIKYSEHYTDEDRTFFPQKSYAGLPWQGIAWFYSYIANARSCGWDEADPANPMWWREPNRALMRSEGFIPTYLETRMSSQTFGNKIFPPDLVKEELGEFPLSEAKKPTEEGMPR